MEAADRLGWARTTRMQVRRPPRHPSSSRASLSPAHKQLPPSSCPSAPPLTFRPLMPCPPIRFSSRPLSLLTYFLGRQHAHSPALPHARLSAISRFPASSPAELLSKHTVEVKTGGVDTARAGAEEQEDPRSAQTRCMRSNVSTRRARTSWRRRDKMGKRGLIVTRVRTSSRLSSYLSLNISAARTHPLELTHMRPLNGLQPYAPSDRPASLSRRRRSLLRRHAPPPPTARPLEPWRILDPLSAMPALPTLPEKAHIVEGMY